MSIRYKMLIPMAILVLVAIATVLVSIEMIFSGYIDDTYEQNVLINVRVAEDKIEELENQAELAASRVVQDDDFQVAMASGDRQAVVDVAARLLDEMDVGFLNILDGQGNVIVRADNPMKYGDSLTGQLNVSSALRGVPLTTIETGSVTRLSIYSSSPVYDGGGELIGVVSSGFRFDSHDFVDELKGLLGAEFTVFVGNERISTTITNEKSERIIGTTAGSNVTEKVLAGSTYTGMTAVAGQDAFVAYVPLKTSQGDIIGMLFSGVYTAEKTVMMNSIIWRGVGIAAALLAVAVLVIVIVARRITKPIHTMVEAAERLASGDVDVDVRVDTKDEMKNLADAFNSMIEKTREQAEAVETIAEGDLTFEVTPRSEKDVVSIALGNMLDRNNDAFSGIMIATSQVSFGASQVAEGAQQLAQSNTEQAAAIDALHVNVQQIAKNTAQNATMSAQAAELSRTIRENAYRGSEQMGRMMTAVQQINDASTSIGDVIKVIDNIAFQTNILALNASVEAARAGASGKSFAVVAEEVRNLASKSANAAKDTAQLISDSIEKAAVGTKIAQETAGSLKSIVEGVEKSAVIVEEISKRSEEQADSIESINTSLEQMSQVVQMTSSLSEETAASSEEMSSQSRVLADMVGRFRLRDASAALPAGTNLSRA